MLASKSVEHLARWLRSASLHASEPSLNPLDGLHAFEENLVGFSILDDDLGLPVNRQDQGIPCLLEAVEKFRRVSLEVAEGSDVVRNVQHGGLTKFASNLIISLFKDLVNDLDSGLAPVTPEAAGSSPVDPANPRRSAPYIMRLDEALVCAAVRLVDILHNGE